MASENPTDCELFCVEWMDTFGPDINQWQPCGDVVENTKPVPIQSVGWMLHEVPGPKGHVIIVSSVDHLSEETMGRGFLCIPNSAIVRKRKLRILKK